MTVKHVFITGMEKCGTTALSEWMVTNGLAEDRVPGEKEPYIFSNDDPHPAWRPASDLPLLDASVGYAGDPAALRRMPEHDTRVVLCLRNQLERTWSAYKMKKLYRRLENEEVRNYFASFHSDANARRALTEQDVLAADLHAISKRHFPRRSHGFIEQYGKKELEHIQTHDFAARIEYELAFYLSRRTFPLFSIILASLYYFPIRNLLEKYQPSDIAVVSVAHLDDAQDRRRFVEAVFEKNLDTPAIPRVFTSAEIEIDEPKPDFKDKAFDLLRACFRYDLAQARELIAKTRFGDSMLDNAELDRYLDAR